MYVLLKLLKAFLKKPSVISAPSNQGEKAYAALETSLKKLDCGYIDLYLIHWPGVFGINGSDVDNSKKRDESWKQMVKGVKNGLTKNIGVSNYNVNHLKELLANDHSIKPAVNQVSTINDFIIKTKLTLQYINWMFCIILLNDFFEMCEDDLLLDE